MYRGGTESQPKGAANDKSAGIIRQRKVSSSY